jgi:Tol biopolymer transport system component
MGEVYKARDTRLDRLVAIKTSKTEFSERFEREARAVAALNHPNICQLYDLGRLPDGGSYLVMEYVDGSPISGADSPRKLLDLAVQLADGMAAAHAAGFTHRDLKPDNILVTGPRTAHPGRVKILDFGLAKHAPILPQTEATQTAEVTGPGTVMGTVAYMSPEQARGEAVDARSDQFSFGLILYELAARKRAFVRPSAAETMAAIIREEAEPLQNVPAPLRWVVERCLAKDPAERYDSTKDLYRELKLARERLPEATTSLSGSAPASSEAGKRRWSWGWLGGLAAGMALAGIGFWVSAPEKAKLKHTPMEVTWANSGYALWAPDGRSFAYSAEVNRVWQVFVRYLDAQVPVQLTRMEASAGVVGWSADSRRVVILSRNPKGTKPPFALFTVPVTGGEPEWVQPVEGTAGALSPDGQVLAELRREEAGGVGLYLTTPLGGTARKLQPWPIQAKAVFNGSSLRFAPDGKSVWLWFDQDAGRQLWRIPLPAGSGAPQQMLQKEMRTYGGTPTLSFLGGERHAVVALQDNFEEDASHLWMVDLRDGKRDRLTAGTASEIFPSLSPDGARLLYTSLTREFRVVSMSLEDAGVETVIASTRPVGMPAWAAGQEKFTYVSHRNGGPAVWVRENGADRPIVTAGAFPANAVRWFMTPALSADGGRVIYTRVGVDNRNENWISSLGGGPPVRLTSNGPDVTEYGGSWSPDGSQFAFLQIQNGEGFLAVAKTSGGAAVKILRSGLESRLPQWSPDGKWIQYRDGKRSAWVQVSPDGKEERVFPSAGDEELTFSKDSSRLYGIRSKDGRHTLFSLDIATKGERKIGEIDPDYRPGSFLIPGIRLSLSPDGKRILYSTVKGQTSLWMIEGLRRPGWLF